MRIGELAKSLDVTTKTLRHYERIDLLPASSRRENGYRRYSPQAVDLAHKIVALRRLGLPLESIKDLLQSGPPDTLRQRLIGILDQRRQEMQVEIAVLQGRQEDLEARFLGLMQTPPLKSGNCICGLLNQPCACDEA